MAPVTAFVGLGSNLAEPRHQVASAFEALAELPQSTLTVRSSLYRSAPLGPQDQPDYINAVVALKTALAPLALLEALQAIEQRQGRVRGPERWGPRTLDLDLLLYGDAVLKEPRLTLPHPGLRERAFVLVPLAEIAPALILPDGSTLAALAACCDRGSLAPLPA